MGRQRVEIAFGDAERAREVLLQESERYPEGSIYRDLTRILADVAAAARALRAEGAVPAELTRKIVASAREHAWPGFATLLAPIAARVCADALRMGIETEFVRHVIRERGLSAPDPYEPSWPWPIRIHALGGLRVDVNDTPIQFGPKRAAQAARASEVARRAGAPRGRHGDRVRCAVARCGRRRGARCVRHGGPAFAQAARPRRCASAGRRTHRPRSRVRVGRRIRLPARRDRRLSRPAVRRRRRCALVGRGARTFASALSAPRARSGHGARAIAASSSQALALYEAALAQDPLAENLYRGAIRCHLAAGRAADALRVYRRCRDQLSIVLGVAPSKATADLVASISRR